MPEACPYMRGMTEINLCEKYKLYINFDYLCI